MYQIKILFKKNSYLSNFMFTLSGLLTPDSDFASNTDHVSV